jgi:hypothetical protein
VADQLPQDFTYLSKPLVKLLGAAVGEEDEQHDVRNAFSSEWPGCAALCCLRGTACLVLPGSGKRVPGVTAGLPYGAVQPYAAISHHTC